MQLCAASVTFTACLLASCATTSSGLGREVGPAESAGFSGAGLARVEATAERLIAEGAIAGAVVLLERDGRIGFHEAFGHADVAAGRAMGRDALFRVCSMSKLVTSVAALILFEEGRFLLDDPVQEFLPEFADARVLAGGEGAGAGETVPAGQPITIRHLLTHTSGITYCFVDSPVLSKLYSEAGILDGLVETELDIAENVRRIARQPLLHQPGERFTYGLNTDVLGRLVEVVSGQSLGEFLRARVFAPLGMEDTRFHVGQEERARLATVYRTDGDGAPVALGEGPQREGLLLFSPSFPYAAGSRYESGGAGLVTTAADYARFCRMLAGGGTLDGARILGRKTVELLSADHLATLPEPAGVAFGLGVMIAPDPGRSGAIPSAGTLSWDGLYTTRFWIDPAEDFVGVVMTQTYPYNSGRALDRLQSVAYQALAD